MLARTQRPFTSTEDLAQRVPTLSQANLNMLARIGALNKISRDTSLHRRDALWQVQKAGRRVGPLLREITESGATSPLLQMDIEERLVADYQGTGMTTGPHPMTHKRRELQAKGIKSAAELIVTANGRKASVAGCVITRQRPGTAKGLIFMTLEDETGHANVIVTPDFFEKNRQVVVTEQFVRVFGTVQNQDGTVHLRAEGISPLQSTIVDYLPITIPIV